MDKEADGTDPYAPSDAQLEAAPSGDGQASRAARLALYWCVAGAVLVGAAAVVQFGTGLRRFGGEEFIPRVVTLSAVRETGARIAIAATCIGVAVAVPTDGTRTRPLVAVGIPTAALITTALMVISGVLTATVGYQVPPSLWWDAIRSLELEDFVAGIGRAALYGVVVASVHHTGVSALRRCTSATKRGAIGWFVGGALGSVLELAISLLRAP